MCSTCLHNQTSHTLVYQHHMDSTHHLEYHTDDLAFWPDLQRLDPDLLPKIDRFYQCKSVNSPNNNSHQLLLLWTHEDQVLYLREVKGQRWTQPSVLSGFSGQQVISVANVNQLIGALTQDGRFLLWDSVVGGEVRFMLNQIQSIHSAEMLCDSLFALSYSGQVYRVSSLWLQPEPMTRLHGNGPIWKITSCYSKLMALTQNGMCYVLVDNMDQLYCFSMASLKLQDLLGFKLFGPCYFLSRNGKLYSNSIYFENENLFRLAQDNNSESEELDFQTPELTPEPIRTIHSGSPSEDDVLFEGVSGRLYTTNLWTQSSVTSVADSWSLYLGYHVTPNLTRITEQARAGSRRVNNPRLANVTIALRPSDLPRPLQTQIYYVTRELLLKGTSEKLRQLVESRSNSRLITIDHPTLVFRTYDIFVHYLRFLETGNVEHLDSNCFDLYAVALLLKDSTLQDLTEHAIVSLLTRLYRCEFYQFTEGFRFEYLSLCLQHYLPLLTCIKSYVSGRRGQRKRRVNQGANRSRPDQSLAGRLVRYIAQRASHFDVTQNDDFVNFLFEKTAK